MSTIQDNPQMQYINQMQQMQMNMMTNMQGGMSD